MMGGMDGKSSEVAAAIADPRPEAVAAADWWASKLGHATFCIGNRTPGERDSTAFALAASAMSGRGFTDEQVDAFRREGAKAIEEHLRRWETGHHAGSWRPEEPQWGSALRVIAIDYGSDPVLRDAARRAGFELKTLDLPLKTVMWINPGIVRVAEGYGAEPVVLWAA